MITWLLVTTYLTVKLCVWTVRALVCMARWFILCAAVAVAVWAVLALVVVAVVERVTRRPA